MRWDGFGISFFLHALAAPGAFGDAGEEEEEEEEGWGGSSLLCPPNPTPRGFTAPPNHEVQPPRSFHGASRAESEGFFNLRLAVGG